MEQAGPLLRSQRLRMINHQGVVRVLTGKPPHSPVNAAQLAIVRPLR